MFCGKCGKKIEPDGIFCRYCREYAKTDGFSELNIDGMKNEECAEKPKKVYETKNIPEKMPKKKGVLAGVIIGIISVVFIAGGIFGIMRISDKNDISEKTDSPDTKEEVENKGLLWKTYEAYQDVPALLKKSAKENSKKDETNQQRVVRGEKNEAVEKVVQNIIKAFDKAE